MSNGTERTIVLFPHTRPGPRKIIIDYYDDSYTPLDCVGGLITWMLENPGYIQEWARYVDAGTGDFSEEDAKHHFQIVAEMLFRIHDACDHWNVYVTGPKGAVN